MKSKVFHIEHEYICTDPLTSKNGLKTAPLSHQKPYRQTVILDGPPPILDVSSLGVSGAVEVYALLFESAYKDRRLDRRATLPWSERQDCGGTSEWSIKGLASQLNLGKAKVGKAIDALLDAGFIQVLKFIPSHNGSYKRLFRVTKFNQLEAVRYSISIMGEPFGKTSSDYKARIVDDDVDELSFDLERYEEIDSQLLTT